MNEKELGKFDFFKKKIENYEKKSTKDKAIDIALLLVAIGMFGGFVAFLVSNFYK